MLGDAQGVHRSDIVGLRRDVERQFRFFGAPVGLIFTMDLRLEAILSSFNWSENPRAGHLHMIMPAPINDQTDQRRTPPQMPPTRKEIPVRSFRQCA
jgi:hypothetical protein